MPARRGGPVEGTWSHRHNFDRAIRSVGVRFVEVETRADLERAIGPNTAMLHSLA